MLESSVEADIAQDDASEFTELQVAARQWLVPITDLREIGDEVAFSTEERRRSVKLKESSGMGSDPVGTRPEEEMLICFFWLECGLPVA